MPDTVFDSVARCASRVSGVSQALIAREDELKTKLGMNQDDLVQFCALVSDFIRTRKAAESLPFVFVDQKKQTIGGVADETQRRIGE